MCLLYPVFSSGRQNTSPLPMHKAHPVVHWKHKAHPVGSPSVQPRLPYGSVMSSGLTESGDYELKVVFHLCLQDTCRRGTGGRGRIIQISFSIWTRQEWGGHTAMSWLASLLTGNLSETSLCLDGACCLIGLILGWAVRERDLLHVIHHPFCQISVQNSSRVAEDRGLLLFLQPSWSIYSWLHLVLFPPS